MRAQGLEYEETRTMLVVASERKAAALAGYAQCTAMRSGRQSRPRQHTVQGCVVTADQRCLAGHKA